MDIIIGADLVPTQSNAILFSNGDVKSLLGLKLLSLLDSMDMRIFNLETPLCDKQERINKCGPHLIASADTIKGIKALNPTLLSLANNHILDHGGLGLRSTMDILNKNKIHFIGAGDNLFNASKPYIFEQDQIRVGIYACADHEFSIATRNTPGANPLDPLESLDHIQNLKKKCDYVIALYHGGKEYYRYPSPFLQKICRKMIQKGAGLVICQHSHCIGCYEDFNKGTIIYGQGNFIFDATDNEFERASLLIRININKKVQIEYIPIIKIENGVRLAEDQMFEEILLLFQKRSEEILKRDFIEEQYLKFALKNIDSYLRIFLGLGKWISRIDRILLNGMLMKKKYSKKQLLAIQNYLECEAHRELIIAGLKGRIIN